MENEYLKIFDEYKNEIGVASRSDVHRLGYWHETFHCWFTAKHEGTDYIYLQLRSENKKDYPNLLDITVAGHLTADETVQDGVREIKEEIGIDIPFINLVPLGIMDDCVIQESFIDKELAHVFLYRNELSLNDFIVQSDEVSGIVLADFDDFSKLWLGESGTIKVKGFKVDKKGEKNRFVEYVGKDKFVPHQISFYKEVIQKIKEQI